MTNNPLVSVVIPTYNSGKTIAQCLQSIVNQTYKNIEIILVDNFSLDSTREIASNYNARVIKSKASRAKARNIGILHAHGRFVLCIDSDMKLTRNVIKDCVSIFQRHRKIGGVVIPERSVGSNFWSKVRDFERSFYIGTDVESARFFPRDIALKAKGYEENVVFYEESTLPQKIAALGYNVKPRITSYILHHEPRPIYWLKKKYEYAKTLRIYFNKYNASQQANIIYRALLFLRDKRFYSKPLLALGVVLLKTLEYLSTRLGQLIGR
jgi:glycosyltransferase involved in cell wall biosynthesis